MKLLQITASYKPAYIYGGPTISVSRLCEALVAKGNDVTVLTTTANGKEDFDIGNGVVKEVDGVKVHYFKRITKDHSHLSPALLKYLYKNIHNYDVIHIQAWWNLVSMGAAFVCRLKGKQFILSPRGTLSSYTFGSKKNPLKKIFQRTIGNWLLKDAFFQVSSQKEAEDIKDLFNTPKISIIPNIIQLPDVDTIKAEIIQGNNRPLKLIFFSRIEKKKGLEFILTALNKAQFAFVFDIYGTGEENYIEQLKELVNPVIISKINWKGSVYGEMKFQILSEYDLMVLPSYDENFANVVIESLSVGTAVLITGKVGLSDYVFANKLGWLCKQEVENVKLSLNEINRNRNELLRIRKTAPDLIKIDFSEEYLISKYLEFYKSVL